jgi:polyribonucleotide nucleotidyltransferase
MDFKVAGTSAGITALQMDIKITGVTFDILRDALAQAKEAREDILGQMAAVQPAANESLSAYAPRISQIQIDESKIGLVIGKGGETIRGLQDEFESQIDINDDGTILVYSASGELAEALIERLSQMTKEVEVGDAFTGKVVKTTTFGAFVELAKGTDGLLHISNVSPGQRVDTVEDVLNKGDEIEVRVVEVDRERGRIGLRLADDPDVAGKSAEELATVGSGSRPPGGNGGAPRGGDRGGRGGRDRGGDRGGERGERGSGRPRHRSNRDPERD